MPRSVPVLLGLHDTARSELRICHSGKGGPGASVSYWQHTVTGSPKRSQHCGMSTIKHMRTAMWREQDVHPRTARHFDGARFNDNEAYLPSDCGQRTNVESG